MLCPMIGSGNEGSREIPEEGQKRMKLSEIVQAIDAEVLCCEDRVREIDIQTAYASDLMSDVLAFCAPGSMLLTGLTNIQIVRTAQMLDLPVIVFVRGKTPLEDTIRLAENNGIPVLVSSWSMYETSGILYREGVPACPAAHKKE